MRNAAAGSAAWLRTWAGASLRFTCVISDTRNDTLASPVSHLCLPCRKFIMAPIRPMPLSGSRNPRPDTAMPAPLEAFLHRLSLEITARHVDKLPLLQARLKRGTRVFIALIDPA